MSTHAGKMPKCSSPLISLHDSNPITGNQKPKLPIVSSNKTALSLLETILIQFGMISIGALAAERSHPVPKHTATVGSGARAAQSCADLNMNVDLTGVQTEAARTWTGSSDECYLESDYRLSLEVEHRFGRPSRSLGEGRGGVMTAWPGWQEGECWSSVGRNTDRETKV